MNIHRYSVRMVLLAIVLVVLLGGFIFFPDTDTPTLVPESDTIEPAPNQLDEAAVIDTYYAPLYPMVVAGVPVDASLATTPAERQQGLSHTPYLPEGIVKLFIFSEPAQLSFWMKDMNYSIDILWVDAEGGIVHIEERVSPESYPETFAPEVSAQYVVETAAGFTEQHTISVGDRVDLPSI